MRAAIDPNTREASVEVVSEDKDLMAPIEALDNLEGSLSKGSSLKRYSYSLPLQNKPKKLKTSSSILNVFSPKIQVKERLCCIFPGAMMETKPVIDKIFKEELATIVEKGFPRHQCVCYSKEQKYKKPCCEDKILKKK